METRLHLIAAAGLCSFALAAEPFRPGFHFTPADRWMNDPNGMVFHDGEYHLFYQFNPFGDTWGHMSWGHAVSRDLVSWKHLPVAIPEKDGIMAFSGSAVVDLRNTSGFGSAENPPLVAIFTGHRDGRQDQRLAHSTDRGRTWTLYQGNPVLDIGKADFRDPKVFWHEPTKRWIMVVSLSTERKVSFYASSDLKRWNHLSDFGPHGAVDGIWECPDLFELPMDGGDGTRWVLLLNINPGAPAGGSGCQYFVGTFDGERFMSGEPAATSLEKGREIAGFEGGFDGWSVDGDSFASGPEKPQPGGVTGIAGESIANSFGGGDDRTGTLCSAPVNLDGDWISFRIGGGNHPGDLGIRLRVDGEIVRESCGDNAPHMALKHWDVREFRGSSGVIEIHDSYRESDWGHVTVDDIRMGDGSPPADWKSGLWADFGADYYATVTWSGVPAEDGRRIAIGWMSNWLYADKVPTSPWRGAMTLPRVLGLKKTPDGIRLTQKPVAAIEKLRRPGAREWRGGSGASVNEWLKSLEPLPETLEVTVEFEKVRPESRFAMALVTGENEETVVGYENGAVYVDRTKSGKVNFDPRFAARHHAPVRVDDGRLSLRIFLDRSSVECLSADGLVSITDLVFPTAGSRKIELRAENAAPTV
ncbi:MAG: glycoside hydrolase family 32 protein, partial [Verrucomicrobiae bacterium]|nr:glycoside hydrolase family 32 protein [Verrucomicrobiae bacterium]